MVLKGILNADTGVKEFTNEKGEVIKFRKLSIVEPGNPRMVAVSVPVDYKSPVLGSQVSLDVNAEKASLVKAPATK